MRRKEVSLLENREKTKISQRKDIHMTNIYMLLQQARYRKKYQSIHQCMNVFLNIAYIYNGIQMFLTLKDCTLICCETNSVETVLQILNLTFSWASNMVCNTLLQYYILTVNCNSKSTIQLQE
jgi:hypothetical protein